MKTAAMVPACLRSSIEMRLLRDLMRLNSRGESKASGPRLASADAA